MKAVKFTKKTKEMVEQLLTKYNYKPAHSSIQITLDEDNEKLYLYDWAENFKNGWKLKGRYLYEIENRKDVEEYIGKRSSSWNSQNENTNGKSYLEYILDMLESKDWIC